MRSTWDSYYNVARLENVVKMLLWHNVAPRINERQIPVDAN